MWTAGVGVVPRALAHRGYCGLGMAECKGQPLCGAVGVDEDGEAGTAAKVNLS